MSQGVKIAIIVSVVCGGVIMIGGAIGSTIYAKRQRKAEEEAFDLEIKT
jgi:hypothetical protein